MDGTGTKVPRRTQRMMDAKRHGLWVSLLYVRVTTETALRRNEKRQRVVPRSTMLAYERQLEAAVALEKPFADAVEILDNDDDS